MSEFQCFISPVELVFEITARCNLGCTRCFNQISFAQKGRQLEEMNIDRVMRILDSAKSIGIRRIRFSGGEPLLRPDLLELMQEAQKRKFSIWLNTNATQITTEKIKKLEKYVSNVLVPFNGSDEAADFEWTSTVRSFEDKIQGIELLKKSSIPVVRIGTVGTQKNLNSLDEIYCWAKKLEVSAWEIYRPISNVKENAEVISILQIRSLPDRIIKLQEKLNRPIFIANSIPFCVGEASQFNEVSIGPLFDEGYARVVVDPVGYCKPGYFLNENLGNPEELEKCWNHPFMVKMRSKKFLPTECHGCLYSNKCRGGSRYMAKMTTGNYQAPDPLMTKPVTELDG